MKWINTLFFLFVLSSFNVYAQNQADIRISQLNAATTTYKVGEKVNLSLNVSFRKVPSRARIYAHLLPLSDDSWAIEGGGTLAVKKLNLNFKGTFANKDNGHFQIAPSNYPISMLLKEKEVATTLGNLFGSAPDSNSKIAKSICGDKNGFGFSLAFLVSAGSNGEGSEDVNLSFTIPNYEKYYNGILITPFILINEADNIQTCFFDSKNMFSTRLSVQPNRVKEDHNRVSYDELPGTVLINKTSPSNTSVFPGTPNTVQYELSYQDLKAGAAIYLCMIPMTGDKIISKQGTGSTGSLKGIGKVEFYDERSPYLNIPKENNPVFITPFGLEGALISVIKNGGDGKTSGMITFTPPVFAQTYQNIYVFPVLVIPTRDGNRVLLADRLKGIYLPNSEW